MSDMMSLISALGISDGMSLLTSVALLLVLRWDVFIDICRSALGMSDCISNEMSDRMYLLTSVALLFVFQMECFY